MELIVRAYSSEGGAADVVVDVEPTHRIGDLAAALGRQLRSSRGIRRSPCCAPARCSIPTAPSASRASSPATTSSSGPPYPVQRVPAIPVRAVTLDVLAGRDTGTSLILLQGTFSVGRDPGVQVTLTDPTVSRHHLDVTVAANWSVTVTPREDVENAVTLNGERIDEPTDVGPDDVIGLGATQLAFRPFVRAPGERHDQLGQIEFQRTPYRPPVITERIAKEIGRIPTRPEPRRFQVLSVLAPLGAGLTLFAFTQQITFLALTLMSPLVLVANWFEDRRSGRHRFRRDLEKFRASLDARRDELARLVDEERIERLRAAPDLADLARRAELRTTDLWARGRDAPGLPAPARRAGHGADARQSTARARRRRGPARGGGGGCRGQHRGRRGPDHRGPRRDRRVRRPRFGRPSSTASPRRWSCSRRACTARRTSRSPPPCRRSHRSPTG